MSQIRSSHLRWLLAVMLLFAGRVPAMDTYDPLLVSNTRSPEWLDLTVNDTGRQRVIPVRIYLPARKTPAPVVLFSHGLGGSREGSAYLAEHWSVRGYVCVFIQHPGSDTSVWNDKPSGQRMQAMHEAADARNFLLRVKDVPAVLDALGHWKNAAGHPLATRLDLARVGTSGHSFGAIATQAVSGQSIGDGSRIFTDARIKAAIAFSPSAPRQGGDTKAAFGNVGIPWLLMTGTKDVAPIGNADMKSRLAVFPALPSGGKYELVLYGAEHSAFGDRALPGDTERRNPNHHRAILALSTAFWDAWLRGDPAARAWLDGDGPRSVLEVRDRWQSK